MFRQLPTTPISLSQDQRLILRPGLLAMVIAINREEEGKSPSPFVPILIGRTPSDCKYDSETASTIRGLWKNFYASFTTPGRKLFRLTLPELMVSKLAAAANKGLLRYRFPSPCVDNPEVVRSRLLRALERARRRAQRGTKKNLGTTFHLQLMKDWKAFARWLRFYALGTRASKFIADSSLRRWYRWVLNTALGIAVRELSSRGLEIPSDKLRSLTRQCLAAVRRGRAPFGVRTLITKPVGATYLADFIARRHCPAQEGKMLYEKSTTSTAG